MARAPNVTKKDLPHHKLENPKDLDPIMEHIGDNQFVFLGEASHGTHEYYSWRAQFSKRLIREKGFNFIAVEGDWPDCYKINQWIKSQRDDSIREILNSFDRWPTWMWANWEIAAFSTWLKSFNEEQTEQDKMGFYGLDVYSLWESMDLITSYLEKEDPLTAKLAREASSCFEPYRRTGSYRPVFESAKTGCKDEVVKLLLEVRERHQNYDRKLEAGLNAEINALVMANAEKYYRSMVDFGENSWNIRDRHMMETLNILKNHHGPDSKAIIWAHNTHIGDARATDMAAHGLFNIGELARKGYGDEDVTLIGFGSFTGTVIAGSSWGAPMHKMKVPHAVSGSIEELLHAEGTSDKLLIFDKSRNYPSHFNEPTGHRAIGVVYNPDNERGNYVPTIMTQRYDAFVYIDQTQALYPLKAVPEGHKPPETYPFGL